MINMGHEKVHGMLPDIEPLSEHDKAQFKNPFEKATKDDQSGLVTGYVADRDVLIDYIVRYLSASQKLYGSLIHTEEYKILTAELIKRGILEAT